MLYEFNKKIYVKPFSNKIVEVEIYKQGNEYDVKPTKRIVELTEETKKKLTEVELKQAYEMQKKTVKEIIDRI